MRERRRTADYRRFQEKEHKKRLKALSHYTYGVAWMVDRDDDEVFTKRNCKKSYIKRFYMSEQRTYCKHCTNRKVRHFKGELYHPSDYQKLYDYWWELY